MLDGTVNTRRFAGALTMDRAGDGAFSVRLAQALWQSAPPRRALLRTSAILAVSDRPVGQLEDPLQQEGRHRLAGDALGLGIVQCAWR